MKVVYHTISINPINPSEEVNSEKEKERKREAARLSQQKRREKEDYKPSYSTDRVRKCRFDPVKREKERKRDAQLKSLKRKREKAKNNAKADVKCAPKSGKMAV